MSDYIRRIRLQSSIMKFKTDIKVTQIAHDNPSMIEEDNLRYDACLELSDKSIQPEGEVQEKQIHGGKCAVFFHKGSYELLGETYKNIGDWLVNSGISLGDEPLVQKYLDLDPRGVDPQELRTLIYLPIR